jgi:hypothetical protein
MHVCHARLASLGSGARLRINVCWTYAAKPFEAKRYPRTKNLFAERKESYYGITKCLPYTAAGHPTCSVGETTAIRSSGMASFGRRDRRLQAADSRHGVPAHAADDIRICEQRKPER